jgi:Tol biopolymer transport system component
VSEFTPLREAVDTLASRAPSPDFGELKRRASRRGRRRAAVVLAAAATAAVIAGSALAATDLRVTDGTGPVAEPQLTAKPAPAPNGWLAVGAGEDGGDIYLSRLGENPRRLDVAGSDATNESCPAWSPDGTRLLFGRVTGPGDSTSSNSSDPELVIVPVGRDVSAGTPTVIALDDFVTLEGFDAHPCGVWAPDGRWVAFAGTGQVWLVDTQTGAIRRLPNLRPSDLEWRPGTDELAIAGDMGPNREADTLSTPVTIYTVSTGELRQLGSVAAAHITWSPDGATLAYTAGENDTPELKLVGGDGTNERLLVADTGRSLHGIGPVWSPTGDRIAYQRCIDGSSLSCNGEEHEAVLVSVADGTEKVIAPPRAGGHEWYPFTVTWSPDGTTLLYSAWGQGTNGVIAVPADQPSDATVLIDSIDPEPGSYSHQWVAIQTWGRQPR